MDQLSSTQKIYERIASGEISGFTAPAFNLRVLVEDSARAVFRAAKKEEAGMFIFEIAPSEMSYCDQTLKQYRKDILKAAKDENFSGPIFLQIDHLQINPERYYSRNEKEKKKELARVKKLIKNAVKNGFYNIDIDCSGLKLENNFFETARFTEFIRRVKKENPVMSIGGEVGVIGGKNTTVAEFQQFIEGYKIDLSQNETVNEKPLIKIAIQTGTSHGGTIYPTGELKIPEQDFKTLAEISSKAKKYGLAGAVQHGASTLPDEDFKKFPKTGCCEIHLATAFQNIVFDSLHFPDELRQKIYGWVRRNCADKRKPDENEAQFIYRNRKYGIMEFKKEIEKIPEENKNQICEQLEAKFRFFMRALNVSKTESLIKESYN